MHLFGVFPLFITNASVANDTGAGAIALVNINIIKILYENEQELKKITKIIGQPQFADPVADHIYFVLSHPAYLSAH